jgi:acetyl-CoA acetyltransferase
MAARASDALIVDAVRSPIGKRNGTLASIRGDELCGQVLNGLVARHDLEPGEIEDVQMGCVTQVGEQGWNVGRMVPLVAGWPETVCGTTVDRQCGSSMQGNFNAAAAVWSGQLDLVVSAGVEMMSRVPMGSNGGDLSERLLDRWQIVPQGISAELIAEEWRFVREELDAFSLESHRRAIAATDEGRFENEIVPVTFPSRMPAREPVPVGGGGPRPPGAEAGAGDEQGEKEGAHGGTMGSPVLNPHVGVLLAVDETPRRDTSMEALAGLAPAFVPDGKVTAGNSSQICDGAAAVLVASERAAARLGLEPRARFVSFGLAGVDPRRMLHGNPEACEKALARAGLSWDDMAVIEVNEAFASVALQFMRDAGLEDRHADVNPNGGGISLGHPLGATGARITATLLNELDRRDARYGIATMCIGFGQALAAVVERVRAR